MTRISRIPASQPSLGRCAPPGRIGGGTPLDRPRPSEHRRKPEIWHGAVEQRRGGRDWAWPVAARARPSRAGRPGTSTGRALAFGRLGTEAFRAGSPIHFRSAPKPDVDLRH
jgi:hypothetical protein